jgi:hypothetical protein
MEADRDGIPRLLRQKNTAGKTLFVVDEASMLGNQAEFGIKGILEELIRFVFEDESNRLLIIRIDASVQQMKCNCSIHGTTVNKLITEGEGELSCQGSFTTAAVSVNGNDDSFQSIYFLT